MTELIVPSDRINTNIPLYAAIGLTEAESNAVYFTITQDIIPTKKTVAECLVAIANHKGWNDKHRIWATYNLRTELLAQKGIPKFLLDKLGEF
jgi:hypothetical protein